MQGAQDLESTSGVRSSSQHTAHQSGKDHSGSQQDLPAVAAGLHADMGSADTRHDTAAAGLGADLGQHGSPHRVSGAVAEAHHASSAHERGEPRAASDAHAAHTRAAGELATPRGGAEHQAGFGSPLDALPGILQGLDIEDSAASADLQHASHTGQHAAGASEVHAPASDIPASGGEHRSASSLPEQEAGRSDQALEEDAALGNGPSTPDVGRPHASASGRAGVENAFAVDPHDGDVGWASRYLKHCHPPALPLICVSSCRLIMAC